jgi:hypothetical protein
LLSWTLFLFGWGLNSGLSTWKTYTLPMEPCFAMIILEIEVSRTIFLTLLTSVSQVTRITCMSHWCLFLTSFSINSLLYRKCIEFHMLILYFYSLLKVYIRSENPLVGSLAFFNYTMVPFANSNSLNSFLFYPFSFFLLLCYSKKRDNS